MYEAINEHREKKPAATNPAEAWHDYQAKSS
jgi:hypothetical protein